MEYLRGLSWWNLCLRLLFKSFTNRLNFVTTNHLSLAIQSFICTYICLYMWGYYFLQLPEVPVYRRDVAMMTSLGTYWNTDSGCVNNFVSKVNVWNVHWMGVLLKVSKMSQPERSRTPILRFMPNGIAHVYKHICHWSSPVMRCVIIFKQ